MRADHLTNLRLGPKHSIPSLNVFTEGEDGDIAEGLLRVESGHWYPILRGVPCLIDGPLRPNFSAFAQKHGLNEDSSDSSGDLNDQATTTESFSAKWDRIPSYGLDDQSGEFLRGWYVKKFGLRDEAELDSYYRDFGRILEVGPGSGFNVRYMAERTAGTIYACDISDGALSTYKNTRQLENVCTIQADLNDLPFEDNWFDFIIADGVLHHTPDTRTALRSVWQKLKPGGQIFFYVYRQMGAAREFCDDHIRQQFAGMPPEQCEAACEALTELGRALSNLNATVTLDKPIDVLGIPAGKHDVQRLIYYNFLKCFWNDSFDFNTNNMVNFDWYHPHSAFRHTQDEVEHWLEELGAQSATFTNANPNGISCVAIKSA